MILQTDKAEEIMKLTNLQKTGVDGGGRNNASNCSMNYRAGRES